MASRVFKTWKSDSTKLTPRERSVLRMLTLGYSQRQIAKKLDRNQSNINGYVRRLRDKFRCCTRELPLRAFAIGLVDVDVVRLLGHGRDIEGVPPLIPTQKQDKARGWTPLKRVSEGRARAIFDLADHDQAQHTHG